MFFFLGNTEMANLFLRNVLLALLFFF